jgi:hypothetical protein
MNSILQIPSTLDLLCTCWNAAEISLRAEVANNCPDIDEEAITQMFHAKLSESLRLASREKRIESAFLKDLQDSFPTLHYSHGLELQRIAQGIIADVTLHKRSTERVTGGDLGFMIVRPYIQLEWSSLHISDYRRGLLTQAKLKRLSGWGTFTSNQKKILPERLDYLALLLYSYEDDARRQLSKFSWQLCSGVTFNKLKGLLMEHSFQGNIDSCGVIRGLGNATIGTDDNSIIDEFISPEKNPSLIIRIFWPHGGPGSEVYVYTRQETEEKAQVLLRY